MAAISLGGVGSGSNTTSGTTLAVTASTNISAGTLLVIALTFDNHASTTAPTLSLSAAGGGSWTQVAITYGAGVTTTAGSGIWGAVFTTTTTSAISSGATITTVTFGSAIVKKVAQVTGYSGVTATTRVTWSVGALSGISTSAGTLVAGDLVIGTIHGENNATPGADTDTLNGSWSAIAGLATSGGSANTNVAVGIQSKVITAAGAQTYNGTSANDVVSFIGVLVPVPDPTITQAAYRYYFGTASESTDNPMVAQDTVPVFNMTGADVSFALRVRLQVTANAGFASDDYQLQWEKNASGTWTNVGGTTVVGYNTASLTEGEATTNRLTGGTGSFVAGKVSEDGLVDDLAITTGNFTELLYSLQMKTADFANSDVLRFRVLRNGATTGMTYTQTPTVNVLKTLPKVETLIDTFDTQLDSAKWPIVANGPVWEAGRIRLGATATNYCGFATGYTYDATDSSVFCKITPPPAAYTREIALGIEASAANQDGASIIIYGGRGAEPNRYVLARRREGNTNYNTGFTPYDPTKHAYVRIRMVGTTQFKYDSSPDGINWTEFASETTALNMTSCKVICQSGQWQTESDSPQYGFIDNVNTAVGSIRKVATLTDDFATEINLLRWDTEGTVIWEAGQVKLTMPSVAYSRLRAMEAFDLRESSFFCKITRPTTGFDSSEVSLLLRGADNVHSVQMFSYYTGGQWYIGTRVRENNSNNDYANAIPFPEVCWWRIRMVGATIHYEYSTDGTAWTLIDSKPCSENNFAILRPVFEFGHWQAHGPLTGYLDNVNVLAATGRPKVWTGSAMVQKPAKVWNGSAWVEKPWKVWTGTEWKKVT